jgi:hypothetical protein
MRSVSVRLEILAPGDGLRALGFVMAYSLGVVAYEKSTRPYPTQKLPFFQT